MRKDFYNLSQKDRKDIFQQTANKLNLPIIAVEKDWWVVQTLEVIFSLPISKSIVFKGGTSLSKAWELIERFSEDIDLALDKSFLGFEGDISNTQVKNLRKKSQEYIRDTFLVELEDKFKGFKLDGVKLKLEEKGTKDQDPISISVEYPSVLDKTEVSKYIRQSVLIEIGSRSMREPFEDRSFSSYVGEVYKERPFADERIVIPTVRPERTYLEKLFLLHEEFLKEEGNRRVNRLSRHLYDIYQISKSEYGDLAVADVDLYDEIIRHREKFVKIRGINYSYHHPPNLNPIPPGDDFKKWEEDYESMQESMIFGESPNFIDLLRDIGKIKDKINSRK